MAEKTIGNDETGQQAEDPLAEGILAFFEQKGLHIKNGIDGMEDWDWPLMREAALELSRFIQANAGAILGAEIRKRRIIQLGKPKFKIPPEM